METQVAFCSACFRNVPVLVMHGPWQRRDPSMHDAEEAVVCLRYGDQCTGQFCPLFRLPDELPTDRLAGPGEAPPRSRT